MPVLARFRPLQVSAYIHEPANCSSLDAMTSLARTRDILQALIGFDTTSRDSNLPLIEWVEDYLRPFGATLMRLPDPTGTKANLWARIGPDAPGGIVLSGHTDVVPVDGQPWTSDPFQ